MNREHGLTPREQEVLLLIAEGHSNSEIGKQLEISPRTVDSHRTNIRNKTGIHNLAGMIRFCLSKQMDQVMKKLSYIMAFLCVILCSPSFTQNINLKDDKWVVKEKPINISGIAISPDKTEIALPVRASSH